MDIVKKRFLEMPLWYLLINCDEDIDHREVKNLERVKSNESIDDRLSCSFKGISKKLGFLHLNPFPAPPRSHREKRVSGVFRDALKESLV